MRRLCLALPLALTACGTESSDPDVAPDVDAAPDVTDATPDVDATPDSEPDAVPDATPDTEPDVVPDATPDLQPDVTEPDAEGCSGDRVEPWGEGLPLDIPIDGQPIMLGSWDGREDVRYLIDTGAQIVSYDVDLTEGSVQFFNAEETDLGTTVLCDIASKGRDLSEAEAYIGVNIDALLGQSAIRSLYVFIDYETPQTWLFQEEPSEAPPGFEDIASYDMPYELQNELPVATLTLTGGVEVALLTDTGSGVTIIEQTFFDEMAAAYEGELPRLDGYVWATNYGTDDSFITRIPSIDIGGFAVEGEWAVVIPDDNHIRALLEGSLVFIDGFLGYPVYRRFLTEVRGPDFMFRFWPYPEPTPHTDEWHKVGLEFVQREGVNYVEMIFSPSAAADEEVDIERGDLLTAIDGESLDGWTLDEVRRALHGEVGAVYSLTFEDGVTGDERVIDLPVEDLLPVLE